MLHDVKLPKLFWPEAMHFPVDLINLSHLDLLDSNVPKRAWTEKDVCYKYLRVFGYKAYGHTPKDERSKLGDKSKECIFLGCGHEELWYRLCDLMVKKLIKSRNLCFLKIK